MLRHGLLLIAVAGSVVVGYDWAFWYNYVNLKLLGSPSFADAMSSYPIKEQVVGDLRKPIPAPEKLDHLYAEAVRYAETADSYALLIWQGGELVVEQYWGDFDAELRPESASMHKSIVGILVGLAIEDGYILDVDDPVKKYVTEWDGKPKGEIPIRDFLTMSSGIEPYPSSDSPFSDYWRLAYGMRLERMMLGLEPARPTGEWFHYANVNSQLLGLVLERATNKRYADYLSERLWRRIGAGTAYVWLDRPNGMPRTYAGYLARARDWLRLGLVIKDNGHFQDESVIPSEWLAMMTAPSARNANYGFQIWLSNEDVRERYYNEGRAGVSFRVSEPFLSGDLIYFDGYGGQRVYVSREDDYVIVRTGPAKLDWDESILPNIVASVAGAPLDEDPSPKPLDAIGH